MAIERRKAAGKVELMFGDGGQCFFSRCSSSRPLSVPLFHNGNIQCRCISTVYTLTSQGDLLLLKYEYPMWFLDRQLGKMTLRCDSVRCRWSCSSDFRCSCWLNQASVNHRVSVSQCDELLRGNLNFGNSVEIERPHNRMADVGRRQERLSLGNRPPIQQHLPPAVAALHFELIKLIKAAIHSETSLSSTKWPDSVQQLWIGHFTLKSSVFAESIS